MARKYKKKKSNNAIIVLLVLLIGAGSVGLIGKLSNGFKNWNVKEWIQSNENKINDNREGLIVVDTTSDLKGSLFTESSIVTFLNKDLDSPVFEEVATLVEENSDTGGKTYTSILGYVYQDNGGMKFGTASNNGYFTINLVSDYTFNKCKIVGRNYSTYSNSTSTYTCDNSSISVNDSEMKIFTTNADDTSVIAPIEEFEFSFDEKQSQLKITTEGKRCVLFSIELWSE